MSSTNIRVPPDSTGKKIATIERTEIHYDNLTIPFNKGDILTGASSAASGEITSVIVEGFSPTEGEIYLKNVIGTFTDNENLQVSGQTHAISKLNVNPQTTLNYQKMVISDPNNPEFTQKIDRFGATVNTFTDGAPTFTPFGAMVVGERQTIQSYNFPLDSMDDKFYDQTAGGGSLTYDSNASTIVLSCGTASGDMVKRTSHFYHPYEPGNGQVIQMTVACGDEGKLNVVRRWGYFDADNGVYWELDGTQLSVVIRSSSSGSFVENRIFQQDFSDDKLDGSDSIGFTLNKSAPNIYWIDIQHLGAGRVRFGINEEEGEQIVAHIEGHANVVGVDFPYMRSGSLPVRFEQENTGAVGSTSEMRVNCAVVKHSSKSITAGDKHSDTTPFVKINGTSGEVALFAIRPILTYNGVGNHSILRFVSMDTLNHPMAGTAWPVVYRIRSTISTQITGGVWSAHSASSTAELNSTMTGFGASHLVFNRFVNPGASGFTQNLEDRELHSLEIFLNADNTTQPTFFVTAEIVSDGTAAVGDEILVGGSLNWEEFKD